MNISKAIRLRVEQLAEERNLTLVELDNLAGLSYNALYHSGAVRNQRYRMLTLITVYRVCKALNMTMSSFFTGWMFKEIDYKRNASQ